MRKAKPKKRVLLPDPKFGDVMVTQFVNNLMVDGKKSTAFTILYDALDRVADKAEKERIDKINGGDSLSFQVEKFLKENGDKIPADKKAAVEGPLASLKEAVKNQNVADIDRYSEEINKVMGELYQSMSGAQGGPQPGPQPGPQQGPDAPDEQ